MQAITLDVILRAVFGVRGEERLARFRATLPRLTEASGVVMWLPFMRHNFGPWSPWARFQRIRREVDELVYEEIRLRRAERDTGERDDVLSLLLQAEHEDGSPMSDEELRDELITLLTAGHETSATALAWTFERLLRTPRALERLLDDLDDDAYLDAVVKESLRVRPVVIDVARVVKRDVVIDGWHIPAGDHRGACDRAGAAAAGPLSRAARSSGPSASSARMRRPPTRGSPSAAACAAASGPPLPSSRSRRCCARSSSR